MRENYSRHRLYEKPTTWKHFGLFEDKLKCFGNTTNMSNPSFTSPAGEG